jgi:ABC-type nitrate/sulfonate/bicarbonate transport system permease component
MGFHGGTKARENCVAYALSRLCKPDLEPSCPHLPTAPRPPGIWTIAGILARRRYWLPAALELFSPLLLWSLLALPLGLLIGSFRPVAAILEPLTDLIPYMPAVAFIPLIMLWVGRDESAKIPVIFIGTFFQTLLMVAEDVRRTPKASRWWARRAAASARCCASPVA